MVSDAVQIEVADTGSGIRVPERHRVFEAFYRGGSEAARPPGGAGLGLAISCAIVEAHGGRMWIDDSAIGALVRFKIPTVSGDQRPTDSQASAPVDARTPRRPQAEF